MQTYFSPEKPVETDPPPFSSIEQFFNKDFLSDCLIIDPISSKQIRSHCIVLASSSQKLKAHFLKYNEIIAEKNLKNPHKIKLPIPINVKNPANSMNLSGEIFEKCLYYFYISNNFDFLMNNGLSNENCFCFYSYFQAFDHKFAIIQLEEYIVSEAISPINVIGFLLEALKFKSLKIISKSIEIIEKNFENLIKIKENYQRIRELPFESFTRLLASDGLVVNKEDIVLQVIIDYIYFRENEEPMIKGKSQKNQENNEENLKENLEKPEKNKNEKKTQEKPEKNEKKLENPENPKEKEDKKPENLPENLAKKPEKDEKKPDDKKPENLPENLAKKPEKVEKVEKVEKNSQDEKKSFEKPVSEFKNVNIPIGDSYLLGEIPDLNSLNPELSKRYKLSTEEKLELLLCCRLSYVDHDLLLKVSNVAYVEEFKSIFIEGISAKLLNYENASHEYTINLSPRESYRELVESQSHFIQNKEKINQRKIVNTEKLEVDYQQFDQNSNRNGQNLQKNQPIEVSHYNAENLFRPYIQKNMEKYSNNLSKSQEVPYKNPENLFKSYMQKNVEKFTSNLNNSQDIQFSQQNLRYSPQKTQQNDPPKQYSQMQNFSKNPIESDDRTKYPSNSMIKQPLYRSEEIAKIKVAQSLSPLEFIYKYDFDDNGVFYYLGSLGKSAKWQNPCDLNLVEILFSSIGTGVKSEDFIGRECVNCCTKNEKNAYMSVDLGEERSLFPVCYTIRNRPSKKYVLLNWILEGSVNNNEWYIIDKRINLTEDSHFNGLMQKEREELMQKGQSSTWGIDEENVEGILNELNRRNRGGNKGFRLFRITQVMKNSDGEFNLCLSGFELYGSGFGNKWYF